MVFITDSFFDKATIDVVKYKQKGGGNMYIVKVLVEHAIYKLDTTYDYLSKYQVLAGCRVHIRFGYQQLVGYVVECQEAFFTQKQLEEKNGFKSLALLVRPKYNGIKCKYYTFNAIYFVEKDLRFLFASILFR